MSRATSRPSAVLVVNPNAGRLPVSTRESVIAALRDRFRVEALATTGRDTGIGLAADAADAGAPLVIAFGGDGHVNEVVNGLAGSATPLGIIPGGTMNVFARALGIPLDPLAAIEHLSACLGHNPRAVNLGRMDDRYFTFSAGCGFDAEAAERVDRYVPAKRRFGEIYFYWSAFRVLAGSYRHRSPTMTLKGDFGEADVAMAIACNAGPYAYLANRPIELTPNVALEAGLDVFALKSMRLELVPLYVWRAVVTRDLVHHHDAFHARDLTDFTIVSDGEFSRHVDGEPLAPATSAHFSLERAVLRVRA